MLAPRPAHQFLSARTSRCDLEFSGCSVTDHSGGAQPRGVDGFVATVRFAAGGIAGAKHARAELTPAQRLASVVRAFAPDVRSAMIKNLRPPSGAPQRSPLRRA